MRIIMGLAAAATLAMPALAASDRFALEYRVERADAAKLSIGGCLATAEQVSQRLGWRVAMRNVFPGKLAVMAAGPAGGGASLSVYCIAVDTKTAFVVQALDYMRPVSPAARRVADALHGALMAKAGL